VQVVKGCWEAKYQKVYAPAQQRLQQATLMNAFHEPTDAAEDELAARASIAKQQHKEVEQSATEVEQAAATKQQEEAAAPQWREGHCK
jgi:hypothetical protein